MIIDFISDTHLKYKHLEGELTGDVLVHSGDFSREGSEEEQESFIEWIMGQPHKHKIVVPGNHDRFIEKQYKASPDSTVLEWHDEYGVDLLIPGNSNDFVVYESLKFYGMPYTQFYNNWAWAYDNHAHAAELCEAIPQDTDILITHGPSYGVLDQNSHRHQLGCPFLLKAVKQVKPKIHVHGHVHESKGSVRDNPFTESINAAITHYQREVFTSLVNRGDPRDYKKGDK